MNNNYNLLVAEPWNFESPDGNNLIKGKIINILNQSCIIYKTNHKLKFENIENDILILLPRHRGIDFGDLKNEKLAFNCGLLMPNIEITESESVLESNSKFVIIASFKK